MSNAKRSASRLKIGVWKGRQVWYIHTNRRKERTTFGLDEKECAERQMRGLEQDQPAASCSVASIPIRNVIKWAIEVDPNDASSGQFVARAPQLEAMLEVFASAPVGAVTQARIDKLIAKRWPAHSRHKKGKKIEVSTAKEYCRVLLRAIKSYASAHNLSGIPRVKIAATGVQQNERVFDAAEIERIMLACRGWEWNGQLGQAVRMPNSKFWRVRRTRAPMKKLIVIMLGSGSDWNCAKRLHWQASPDGAISFVDLASGLLHRLGPDAPIDSLKVPVYLTNFALQHLRVWSSKRSSTDSLVIDGLQNYSRCVEIFRSVCVDAGVEYASLEILSRTFAALALRNGARVRNVAISIGTRAASVQERLGFFETKYHREAIDAFAKNADSIK